MTVRDYSTTAGDNTAIEGIALADTMLANALDNAIRQAMADTADLLLDIAKPTASTGSSNIYALSTGGTVASYEDKIRLSFRANFANTGACTINVDTIGAVDLKVYTGSGIANPTAGQIQSGGVYDILYVSALGDFVVLNPSLNLATSAEYYNNTSGKVLSTDQVWSAMAEKTLTDGASIAWDMDAGIDWTVTLAGNRTLANPTNVQVGKKGRVRVVQDGTGSRTLAFGTNFEFSFGTAFTMSTAASAQDILYYDCISATRILLTAVWDIS